MSRNENIDTLIEMAREHYDIHKSPSGDEIMWNPYNKIVQSHRDGEIYLPISAVLAYIKNYNSYREFYRNEQINDIISDSSE